MKGAAGIALVAGVAIGVLYTRFTEERWLGFVYPDDPSLIRHIDIGEFRTLQHCRDSSSAMAIAVGARLTSYECGLNCEAPRTLDGPRLCERTER